MKCRLCESEIDFYPCSYCDASAPAYKRRIWTRPAFWIALVLVVVGASVISPLAYGFYWRRAKERTIKIALATRKPDRLVEGLVSEYELTGADSKETSRCAKAILESQPDKMGLNLRRLIDTRWEARRLAYELIGVVGSRDDALYLIGVFDSSPSERENCVRAVITITATRPHFLKRGTEIARFVSRVLEDPENQKYALETMAVYPQPDFVPFIQELVAAGRLLFHGEAVNILIEIETSHAMGVRDAIYKTGDSAQRFVAALTAARREHEIAVEWLAWLLTDSGLTTVQSSQVEEELVRLEKKQGLSAFIKEYECDDESVRMRAVIEAGELRSSSSIGFIADALRDSSADVRMAAIMTLGRRHHPRAARVLVRILEDMPASIPENFTGLPELFKRAVMEAVGDCGAHEAVPILVKHLEDKDLIAKYARSALIKITLLTKATGPEEFMAWYEDNKDKSRAEYLLEKLSDPSEKVRDCAYRMLINVTGEEITFNAYAPEEDRRRMIESWKNYLSKSEKENNK